MNTVQDLNERIAAVQVAKQQAQTAEAQRLADEQAARNQIAQADAELTRLRLEKDGLLIEQRIQSAIESANAIQALGKELFAALDIFDIVKAATIKAKLGPANAELVRHNRQTLDMAHNSQWDRAVMQSDATPKQDNLTRDDMRIAVFQQMQGQLEKRLPAPLDGMKIIDAWKQAVPEGPQRQFRELISHGVIAWLNSN